MNYFYGFLMGLFIGFLMLNLVIASLMVIGLVIYFVLPPINYFISNYFFLKWFFPNQNNDRVIGAYFGLIVSNFLVTIFTLKKGFTHKFASMLPQEIYSILKKLLGNDGMYCFVQIFTTLSLLIFIQILIQIFFSKQLYNVSSSKILLPALLSNLFSWVISFIISFFVAFIFFPNHCKTTIAF